MMSFDPVWYRGLLPAAVLEKAGFGIAALVLFAQGRIAVPVLLGGLIDLLLGTLFLVAYWQMRPRHGAETASVGFNYQDGRDGNRGPFD